MEQEAVAALNDFGQSSGLNTLIAEWSWLALIAFAMLFFKSTIDNAVAGVQVFFGNEYNEDDIVILNGDRPGRIVRVSVTKTVFYLYTFRDGTISGGTKLAVPNAELASLRIERPLPKLDAKDFFKEGEINGTKNPQKPPT